VPLVQLRFILFWNAEWSTTKVDYLRHQENVARRFHVSNKQIQFWLNWLISPTLELLWHETTESGTMIVSPQYWK
jgi:hypothetical protein